MIKKIKKVGNGVEMKYIVYTPKILKDSMPCILFLHGIGERGNNILDIERYSLPYYLNEFEIPYIVIAPQCHENNFWDYHLRDVEKILNIEEKIYNFDKSNIFVLGSSMGAFGAFNYIIQRPEIFRGIVSASGGIMLPVKENLNRIKDKPILMYHGKEDDIVNVKSSILAYEKLKEVGASNIELKLIDNEKHYVCSTTYKEPYVYKWLCKNLNKNKPKR